MKFRKGLTVNLMICTFFPFAIFFSDIPNNIAIPWKQKKLSLSTPEYYFKLTSIIQCKYSFRDIIWQVYQGTSCIQMLFIGTHAIFCEISPEVGIRFTLRWRCSHKSLETCVTLNSALFTPNLMDIFTTAFQVNADRLLWYLACKSTALLYRWVVNKNTFLTI